MFTCPLCKKKLNALERECPGCRADLTLIVGYVENLAVSIARAEAMTRAGRLGDAVFAYLDVLDADPENAEAKRQVSRVVSAVRNFDSRPRPRPGTSEGWTTTIWLLIVLAATLLGFAAGMSAERWISDRFPPTTADRDK